MSYASRLLAWYNDPANAQAVAWEHTSHPGGAVDPYGSPPQFAAGGDFSGGLRIVGELGPELEQTGPSRIWSADQTRNILSGSAGSSALVNEIKALRAEVSQLRTDNQAQAAEQVKAAYATTAPIVAEIRSGTDHSTKAADDARYRMNHLIEVLS